jgi:S1-C subfamily serine protease
MSRAKVFTAAVALAAALTAGASAQRAGDNAALIVEGTVREVFQSARQSHVDYIVLIDASRVELGAARNQGRVNAPAPGEPVYVHLSRRPGEAGVPQERSVIRALLSTRPQGGWNGAGADWFTVTDRNLAQRSPDDPEPPAVADQSLPNPSPRAEPSRPAALQALGVDGETMDVGGRLALKVNRLTPGGPAQAAGVEPGDVIMGVNDAPITSLDQLATTLRQSGATAKLVVLNVRDGKATAVKVDLGNALADSRNPSPSQPAPTPVPPSQPAGPSLGVRGETVRVGFRSSGLKVTDVSPDGAIARAGIEPEDVIVSANGTAVSTVEELSAAARKAGPVMTVNVRDHRSGKEVPIQVPLGGPGDARAESPRFPTPAPAPSPSPTNARPTGRSDIGLTVRTAPDNLPPGVQVVSVAPGSPAARAGVEAGDVITAVNGSAVFAPDLFGDMVAKGGAEITLTVFDGRTQQKATVKVKTGE